MEILIVFIKKRHILSCLTVIIVFVHCVFGLMNISDRLRRHRHWHIVDNVAVCIHCSRWWNMSSGTWDDYRAPVNGLYDSHTKSCILFTNAIRAHLKFRMQNSTTANKIQEARLPHFVWSSTHIHQWYVKCLLSTSFVYFVLSQTLRCIATVLSVLVVLYDRRVHSTFCLKF